MDSQQQQSHASLIDQLLQGGDCGGVGGKKVLMLTPSSRDPKTINYLGKTVPAKIEDARALTKSLTDVMSLIGNQVWQIIDLDGKSTVLNKAKGFVMAATALVGNLKACEAVCSFMEDQAPASEIQLSAMAKALLNTVKKVNSDLADAASALQSLVQSPQHTNLPEDVHPNSEFDEDAGCRYMESYLESMKRKRFDEPSHSGSQACKKRRTEETCMKSTFSEKQGGAAKSAATNSFELDDSTAAAEDPSDSAMNSEDGATGTVEHTPSSDASCLLDQQELPDLELPNSPAPYFLRSAVKRSLTDEQGVAVPAKKRKYHQKAKKKPTSAVNVVSASADPSCLPKQGPGSSKAPAKKRGAAVKKHPGIQKRNLRPAKKQPQALKPQPATTKRLTSSRLRRLSALQEPAAGVRPRALEFSKRAAAQIADQAIQHCILGGRRANMATFHAVPLV